MISAINIVAFDVPFPANYGGVIDVFHKIKTFNQLGVKVHLHCFEYGRGNQPELEQYCESVNYYKRKSSWIYALSSKPYIVITRKSRELKKNLLSNDFPILFEGLHTCYLLNDKDLKDRITIYRESNIEHRYYNHLAKSEVYWIKKIYLNIEARKLKKFESTVEKASMNFIVSETDFHYFEMKYGKLSNHFIPSFHEHNEVVIPDGLGKFVLYHGNLSVSENYEAAMHLIKNIFSVIKVPFIIAGLNPPGFVAQVVALAFGLAASSFFPAIILGIFDKRMNKEGAMTGMILGILFTASYIIYFKPQLGGPGLAENFWWGISPEGIGTLGMILNFIVALVVSRLTSPPPQEVLELTERIRTPRGAEQVAALH